MVRKMSPLQWVPWYSGEVALAARIQRFRGVAPALHTSIPARIPQIPAAGERRPAGLRERSQHTQTLAWGLHCHRINLTLHHSPPQLWGSCGATRTTAQRWRRCWRRKLPSRAFAATRCWSWFRTRVCDGSSWPSSSATRRCSCVASTLWVMWSSLNMQIMRGSSTFTNNWGWRIYLKPLV